MANGDLQCRAVLCTLTGSSELCIASYVRKSAIRHVPRGMWMCERGPSQGHDKRSTSGHAQRSESDCATKPD